MNNKFSKYVQEFLTDYLINECNRSLNTQKSYACCISLLIDFLNKEKNINSNKIEIETITKEVIIQFLDWLETSRNASISTRNQRLICLKTFFKYIQYNEITLFDNCIKIMNIKNKKVPDKIIPYFSEKEIKMMLNYLSKCNDLKKLTIICILYETGARVSELINIKVSDINLTENASIKLIGKGNKTRIVPINQYVVKIVKKYLKEIYVDYGENYLFYSNQKKKYNRKSINYLLDNLILKLKDLYQIEFKGEYHPHSFRHSKAMHMYNNGVPLLYIKSFLGHSTITSTEIYAKPDSKKQRDIITKNAEIINIKRRYSEKEKCELENWLNKIKL